jgi:CO/xanthine dehydrogenase Mo-binding subunit
MAAVVELKNRRTPAAAFATIRRASPHAHPRIRGIDVSAAMAVPGTIAVLTGADAIEDGLKPIPHRPILGPPDIALGKRDASDKFLSSHRVLPTDKARFAGEAVAHREIPAASFALSKVSSQHNAPLSNGALRRDSDPQGG